VEFLFALIGGGLLVWVIVKALAKPNPAVAEVVIASHVRERQFLWAQIERELDGLLEFAGPRKNDQGVAESIWFNLEQMTMEDTSISDGHTISDEYLLRRTGTLTQPVWELKRHTRTSKPPGRDAQKTTAIQEVMKLYDVGTPNWDPKSADEFNKALASAQAWHSLDPALVPVVEGHWMRAASLFQRYPGIYPGITEAAFMPGKYDSQKVWGFPVHN